MNLVCRKYNLVFIFNKICHFIKEKYIKKKFKIVISYKEFNNFTFNEKFTCIIINRYEFILIYTNLHEFI